MSRKAYGIALKRCKITRERFRDSSDAYGVIFERCRESDEPSEIALDLPRFGGQ